MATPRNSVEQRFRVVDYGQDQLFLQRFLLKLAPFGPGSFKVRANCSNKGVWFLAIYATSLMGRTRGGGSARPSALKCFTTSCTTSQSSP
jgi:hypothetical protein